MKDKQLKLKVICTELPGTRFEDPYGHDPEVKEPVYLGIQYSKKVIEQVPADRREVVFIPSSGSVRNPMARPIFWVLMHRAGPRTAFFIFPGGWCEIRVILRCFGGSKFVWDISIGRRLIGHLSRMFPLL